MAAHSSILAGKIPWTEKFGRLQSMGSQRVGYNWATKNTHTHTFMDRNNWSSLRMSYPLQCSCLENPRDSGDWWAAVYGVARSRTRLKRLSINSSSRNELLSLHQELERVLFSVSGRGSQATDACSVTTRPRFIRSVCWWQNAWPTFGWDSGESLSLLLVLLLRPLWIFLLV